MQRMFPAGSRHEARKVSPDSAVSITVMVGQQLTYTVEWKGRTLIGPSPISLTLGDGTVIGPAARVVDARWSAADEIIEPVVPEKTSRIRDRYNQLSLGFASGWGLDVRAYDDGAAYRFRTGWSGEFAVTAEEFTAGFESDSAVWFPAEESFLTHSERVYERWRVSEIPLQQMASLPLLIAMYNGPKVAITEADLRSYPGLYLAGTSGRRLRGVFPSYPLVEELEGDRTVKVVERAEYLARTEGPRTFPWRVFVVAENDGDLVESTIVYRLAPPLAIDDPSWIRPGKVAWDWWNATGLFGVDFRAGLNTDTYRYFIDFAADHGLEYVILDEGWSEPADLTALNPDIDLATLLAHARDRDVGVVLWVVWNALGDRLEETLDRFAEWGVAGVKVDFMQRDDQKMVEYYWRVARAAAERRLVVDFHGAYKPTGLRRPGAQRHAALHPHARGADGLHTGCHAQRARAAVHAGVRPTHEHRHARASVGDVRRVREPAPDAVGLALSLPRGTGVPCLHGRRPDGVGRDAGALGPGERLGGGRPPTR
jgi:alpha-glucosidase